MLSSTGTDPEQSPKLMNLTKYIEKTWITSSVWPIQNAVIDNLRTEVLIMNERRLIYCRLINHLAYLSMMLILISNDVNPHPGPGCSDTNETVYPCGTCDQPVTWQERGIVCDTCYQWYHISCQSMQTKSYLEHVNDSAIAWDCIMCNCPNYSTFCYSLVFSTSIQFSLFKKKTTIVQHLVI